MTEKDAARAAEKQALGIVPLTDTVLSRSATAVSEKHISSPDVQELVAKLLAAARGQRGNKQSTARIKRTKGGVMVGLAAPQIGISKRIIIVDTGVSASRKKLGRLECFIDPRIIWRSRETAEGREGCFSTGLVWGIVRRPIAVKIKAFTPEGKLTERIFEDFTARIVQHEIDHLDGIRFPDRITTDRKRHWVHVEEFEAYAKQTRRWTRLCTEKQWRHYRKTGEIAG
jgi:peptide deformylase